MRIGLGLGLTRGGKVEPTPGPTNTVAPAITGTAEVGETLTCSSGTWTGNGTITYAYQWRRNGSNIAAATASTYTLVSADDLTTVNCVVTATDLDGSKSASASGVAVTYPAPSAAGLLADQTYTQGSGEQTVNAATDFTGATGGTWSVTGTGASIDSSGTVTITTADLRTASPVTVTYTNSGGSANSAFDVTVSVASVPELTAFSFDTSTQPDTLDGITVSGTWTTIRWQVDGTTSYASPAAMDAAQGAANGFGSFTSLPATIDLTGLADGPYNLHMYAENGSGKQTGAPVSQAITVDNTAATLSSVTGTPSGLNITWGVTSNSAQGTIYAAARLAANPVLTTSEIRNGTGNALATSSDATPAADASNGGTLALGSGGTYRVDVYQDDGFGNISSVVSSSDVVLASYTQNIVDNNGVGRFQWDIGNQPTNGTLNKLTASVWLVNQSIGVTTNVIGGNLTFNLRKNSTEQITVQVWDSAGTTIYNQTSTGLTLSTTSGVLDHIQVTVDLSVPSIAIYFNGSDVTVSAFGSSSISAGTGFLKTGTNNIFFPGNDFQYADFFISYGDALSNSALYNGGTPPNPGTIAGGPLIGSPQILLGGDMVASDWDAGTNIGSGTFTVNATGFTDVP